MTEPDFYVSEVDIPDKQVEERKKQLIEELEDADKIIISYSKDGYINGHIIGSWSVEELIIYGDGIIDAITKIRKQLTEGE